MKRFLTITLFLTLCISLFAKQNEFSNRARALYVLDIAKNVTWSEYASPFDFRIAVLDKDTSLVNRMRSEAKRYSKMHGKPLTIVHYTSIDQIGSVDVIFFERKSKFSVDRVFQKIAGKQVLLITEGYQFHKTMVNFLIINDHKRYEVNEAKIEAAGLKIHPNLLRSSVKSEADWSYLYEHSLLDIASYRNTIKKQRALIRKHKAAASNHEAKADSLAADLQKAKQLSDSLQQAIATLNSQLEREKRLKRSSGYKLSTLQKETGTKDSLISQYKTQNDDAYQMVKDCSKEVIELKKEIELLQKTSEIQQNHETIHATEEKPTSQNTILYLIIAVLLLSLGLVSFRLRRK